MAEESKLPLILGLAANGAISALDGDGEVREAGGIAQYVEDTCVGLGALKGAYCEADSYVMEEGTGNTKVTFKWEGDDSTVQTKEVIVQRGLQGEKGNTGASGVYYGTTTPTDPEIDVWIDESQSVDTIVGGMIQSYFAEHLSELKGERGEQGIAGTNATNYTHTSELQNDSGFITASVTNLSNYYTKTQIAELIDHLEGINFHIIEEFPEEPSTSTIYLKETSAGSNVYSQYMYIDDAWTVIGSTSIDLSNVYTKTQTYSKSEVDTKLTDYWDKTHSYSQSQINAIVGDATLTTDASTLKGAINELDAHVDALNPVTYTSSDNNKILQITGTTTEGVTTYAPAPVGLKTTMSITPADTNVLSELAIKTLLDKIYPLGVIVFGTCPTYGTWIEYDFGGYVCADASLGAGHTMGERLPNVNGQLNTLQGAAGWLEVNTATGAMGITKATHAYPAPEGTSGNCLTSISINAANSTSTGASVYKNAVVTTGYNVEVKGKNVQAWKRIG